MLDTGTWNQLGDFGKVAADVGLAPRGGSTTTARRTRPPARLRVSWTSAPETTGRLAYEIIRALDALLSQNAANHLFTGEVATDTGWFRHPNTTPATFALCGELVAASRARTRRRLYERPTVRGRDASHAIQADRGDRLHRLNGRRRPERSPTPRFASRTTATGAVPGDTEDLINFPRACGRR